MNPILYYLLQMSIASGILYAYYHLALRNKKFHRYNRFYLLAAVVICIFIPFLNIPVYFTAEETHSSLVLQTLTQISSSQAIDINILPVVNEPIKQNWFTWQNLSCSFYILVAFIALLRVLFSLLKIKSIVRNNPVEKLQNIRFINTDEPGTPFSFFKWLFWNRKIELQSEKGEQVFRHELFHIQQKHSLDILFIEMLTVVFWINPFFHLIKKEIKTIHEFLADEFAINKNERWQYAELLLMQAMNTQIRLTNPFFHNQIKRRIAMITSSSKPKYQYLRKLLVLPIASIVIILFAFKYKEKKEIQNGLNVERSLNDSIPKPFTKRMTFYSNPDQLILEADTMVWKKSPQKMKLDLKKFLLILNGTEVNYDLLMQKTIKSKQITFYPPKDQSAIKLYGNKAIDGVVVFEGAETIDIPPVVFYKETFSKIKSPTADNKVFEKVEVSPSFPRGDQAWRRYLERNLQGFNPSKNGAPKGAYTVYIKFVVDENGYISDVIPLTKHGYGMEEKVIEIIKKGPKWVPAVQNGKNVKAYRKQPVTFEIMREGNTNVFPVPTIDQNTNIEKEVVVVVPEVTNLKKKINEVNLSDTSHPLLVINGKEQPGLKISQLDQKVSVNDIESINILKGNNAIQKYGPQGKDGVIEIITKQNQNESDEQTSKSKDYNEPSNWDKNNPEFLKWRQLAIKEVIDLARKEGKAAYFYKGRTYVFAHIDPSKPENVNTYFESDGLIKQFVLNGRIIHSIDEINSRYLRKDIREIHLVFPNKAMEKYNVDSSILEIETYDYKVVTKAD
jgi:beta-lactamase regulating signal transducer with metallopeptidase domain